MAIDNFDQAVDAFVSAQASDQGQVDSNQQQQTDTPDQAGATQNGGQQSQADQSRIDLGNLQLSDEAKSYIEQREREMQADYTRKTQEVAAQRREAEQAMEFISALNSDPQFALQVQQTLQTALEQQGLIKAQQQQFQQNEDQFVDPYMQKINELEQWKSQQEQQYRISQAERQIESSISAVRAENPNYTDDDVKDILAMAFAYNGDIRQAHEAYKAVTQRSIESYLNKKESVPASLNQPKSTGHAEIPPEGFKTLNDPRLEEAARRMLLNSGAQW